MTITKITFEPHGCFLNIDGKDVSLTDKITLPLNGYTVYGDWTGIIESRDIRLVELTARWWRWANNMLPDSVAEAPQLLTEADAAIALRNHLEDVKKDAIL